MERIVDAVDHNMMQTAGQRLANGQVQQNDAIRKDIDPIRKNDLWIDSFSCRWLFLASSSMWYSQRTHYWNDQVTQAYVTRIQ